MKTIKLKEARLKTPWGEKELYIGKVYDHPQWEDGTERPITIKKEDGKMSTELHEVRGMSLGDYEVEFI